METHGKTMDDFLRRNPLRCSEALREFSCSRVLKGSWGDDFFGGILKGDSTLKIRGDHLVVVFFHFEIRVHTPTNYSSTTVASVSVYVFSLIMKGLMESNTSKLDVWCTSKQNCCDPPLRTPKSNTSRSLGVGVFASCPRFQHFSPCLSGGMDEAGRDHFDKDFSGPLAAFFLDLCERIGTELFFGGLLQKKTINATVCQRCVVGWQLETKRSSIQRGWDVWSWFQRARVDRHGVLMSQPGSLWSKRLAASRKDISYRRFRVIVQDLQITAKNHGQVSKSTTTVSWLLQKNVHRFFFRIEIPLVVIVVLIQ